MPCRYGRLKGKVSFNVLAYRDIADTVGKPTDSDEIRMKMRWQFKFLVDPASGKSFIDDVDSVGSFLDGLKVGGGGDVAEDIAGALLKVI